MKKTNLIKKNFYFAMFVVVLLFAISLVIAEYDPSQASHGTLYVDTIEPKSGADINLVGDVGIGTVNPGVRLDVIGDIKSNGKLVCLNDGTNCPTILQGKWDGNKPGNIYYNDGNVGIGTASPLWKLHVNGALMANGTLLVDGGDIGDWDGAPAPRSWMGRCNNDICRNTAGGFVNGDFFFISGVTNLNYGRISDTNQNYKRVLGLFDEVLIPNGNLGVGVKSPQAKLHIVNDELTGDDLRVEDTRDGNYAGIRLFSPDGGQATIDRFPSNYASDPLKSALQISNADQPNAKLRIQQVGDYPIVFHAGLATPERMRIDGATGNVGIGTTTPSEKLEVAGNIKASGTICDVNGCIGGGGVAALTGKTFIPFRKLLVDKNYPTPPIPGDNGIINLAAATGQPIPAGATHVMLRAWHNMNCPSGSNCGYQMYVDEYPASGNMADLIDNDYYVGTIDAGSTAGTTSTEAQVGNAFVAKIGPGTNNIGWLFQRSLNDASQYSMRIWIEGYFINDSGSGDGGEGKEGGGGLTYLGSCTTPEAISTDANVLQQCSCGLGEDIMLLEYKRTYDSIDAASGNAAGVSHCQVRNQNTATVYGQARADAFAGGQIQTTCSFACFKSGGGAAGEAGAIAQKIGTTDITSPAGAANEADMADMSLALNISGTDMLVIFSAPVWVSINGEWGYVNMYVDGVLERRNFVSMYAYFDTVAFQHLVTGLTPGTHAVNLKWYSGSGGLWQRGASTSPRVLTVFEPGSPGGVGGSKIYSIPITTLQLYNTYISCADISTIFWGSGCHRYCSNACASGGVEGCAPSNPDSGLSYVSGYAVEMDCLETNTVACTCNN